jgi:hypothetical protein
VLLIEKLDFNKNECLQGKPSAYEIRFKNKIISNRSYTNHEKYVGVTGTIDSRYHE